MPRRSKPSIVQEHDISNNNIGDMSMSMSNLETILMLRGLHALSVPEGICRGLPAAARSYENEKRVGSSPKKGTPRVNEW